MEIHRTWNFTRRPDYVAGNDRNLQIAISLERVTQLGASIAHQNVRTPIGIPDIPFMRPGHMKWDDACTIGELKPDVIVSLWENTSEEAAPFMTDYDFRAIAPKIKGFLRRDSTKINSDALP